MTLFWLGLVVALAYLVQVAAGFGAGLVGLTLGAFFLPVQDMVALLMPMSTVQTLLVALEDRKAINRRFLLRNVAPLMGAGVIAGFWLIGNRAGEWLRPALGVVILLLVAWEFRPRRGEAAKAPLWARRLALVFAGVLHGTAGIGGPPLVWATAQSKLPKHTFRATLAAVWVVTNSVLIAQHALAGHYTPEALTRLGWMFPAMLTGGALGQLLFSRVDEQRFRTGVYALLTLAAVALILR